MLWCNITCTSYKMYTTKKNTLCYNWRTKYQLIIKLPRCSLCIFIDLCSVVLCRLLSDLRWFCIKIFGKLDFLPNQRDSNLLGKYKQLSFTECLWLRQNSLLKSWLSAGNINRNITRTCAHCFFQPWTLAKLQFSIIKNTEHIVIKNPLQTGLRMG